MENILKLSKGFTWPIVIRGMLGNESRSEGVKYWKDPSWFRLYNFYFSFHVVSHFNLRWLEKYPDEPVLCGTLSGYKII